MSQAMPDCWYASAEFPENTLRSFAQAIQDGSEGIESDVHITADDVIVMFHDTTLDRTTNSHGPINARNYYGQDGLEHVRTLKEPVQQIPTFKELCTLLMEPSNRHVTLNIDIKPNNDPERLFRIMGETVHAFPNYERDLAPRLILGLWHPKFIEPAKRLVPTLRRAHIGASPADALQYFWQDCDAFSIRFPSLVGAEGQAFLRKAREANKDVMAWTVNRKDEMVEATRYGVKAILTDYTADLHQLRDEMKANFDATHRKYVSPWFAWASLRYYSPVVYAYQRVCRHEVEHHAGATTMAHGRFGVASRRPWPVVLWHGLGDAAQSEWMQHTKKTLEEMHPGLFVHVIALEQSEWRDRRATVWGHVPTQISRVHEQLQAIPELRDGFDAVGFSQGGQFLRAYVERFNDPPVRHLLTFGSQHMGITELPECSLHDALCHAVRGALSTRVYSDYAQHHIVTAQYFRDTRTPAQWALYHAKNAFLRDINNEGEQKNETYKQHMLQLQSFVMVQFDEETTVRPANSSWFEAFPAPVPGVTPTHTVPLRDSALYREDWIGLRELDARGSLVFLRCAGPHMHLSPECGAATFGRFLGRPRAWHDELPYYMPYALVLLVLGLVFRSYMQRRSTRALRLP